MVINIEIMPRLPEYMQSKIAWSLLGTRVGIYRISETSVAELNKISMYILRDIVNLANSYRIGADRITLTLDDVQRALLKRNTPIYAGLSKQQYNESLPFARCKVYRGFITNQGLRSKILSQSNCFYLVPTKFRRMIRFVLDNTNANYVRFGDLVGRMLQLYVEHKMGEVLLLANIMAIDQKRQTITPQLLQTAFMKIWKKYNLKDIHWRTLPAIPGTITKPSGPPPLHEEEEEEEEEFEDEEQPPAPPPPIDGLDDDKPPFERPKLPERRRKGRKRLFDEEKKAEPPAFVPFHYPKLTPTPWIGEYRPLRPELRKPGEKPIVPPKKPIRKPRKPLKPGEQIRYPLLKPLPWIGEYQPLRPKPKFTPKYPFDKPRLPKRRRRRRKPIIEEEIIEEEPILPITLPKKKPIKKKPLSITLPPAEQKPFGKPRLPKRRRKTRPHIIEREEEKMEIEEEPETKREKRRPRKRPYPYEWKREDYPGMKDIPPYPYEEEKIEEKVEEWPEISAIPPYLPPIPDYEPPGPRKFVKPKRRLPPKQPALPIARFRFDRTELKQIEDDLKDQGIGFKFDTSQIESLEEKETERRNAELEARKSREFGQSLIDIEEANQMDAIFRRMKTEEEIKEFQQEIEDRIMDDVRRDEERRKKQFDDKIREYEAKNNDDLRVLADELQKAKIRNDEIAAELESLARKQEEDMDKVANDYIAKEEEIKKQIAMENKIIEEFYKFTDEEEALLNEDIAQMKQKEIHELNIIADELQASKIKAGEKNKILNDEAIKTLLLMEAKKKRMAEQKRLIIQDEMRKLELQMERELRKKYAQEKQDVLDEIKRTEELIAEFERQKKIAQDKKNQAKIISKSRELVAVKRSVVDLRDFLEDTIMREEEFVEPKLPKRRKKKRRHLFPPPPPPIPFIVEKEEERALVRKRGQKRRATVPVEEAEFELMARPVPIHQKRRRISAKTPPKKKKPRAIKAPIIQEPFVKPRLPKRKAKRRQHLFPPPPPPIPFIVEQEEERALVRRRGHKRRATVPVEEAEFELMDQPVPIHQKRRRIAAKTPPPKKKKKKPKAIKMPKEKPSLRSRRAQAAFEAKLLKQANDLIKKQERARKKRDAELKQKRDEIMKRGKEITAAEKKEKKESKKAKLEGKEDEHLARQRKIDAFMLQQLEEIDNLQNDMDEVVRKEAKVQEQIERKKKKIDQKVLDKILKFRRPPVSERRPRSVSRRVSRSIRQKKKTKARIDAREKELARTREKVLARSREIQKHQKQLQKMATEKFGPPARYPRKPKSRKKLIEYTKKKRPKAFKKQKRKREVAFSPERLPIELKKEKRELTWREIEKATRVKKKPSAVVLKSRQSYQEQERLLANDERLLKELLEDINERTREIEARRPGERRKGIRTAPIPVEKAELESRAQLGLPAEIKKQKKAFREKWKPLEEFAAHEKFIKEQKALKSQQKFARIKKDIERRAKRRRKKKKK